MNLKKISLRKFYGRQKIALERAKMWFGTLQFFFIAVILLKDYSHTIIGKWVFTHQLISMPLLLLSIVVIANIIKYVEKRLELRQAENTETNKYNREVMKILKDLEHIKKQNDRIENELKNT